jgi:hypothetical protein
MIGRRNRLAEFLRMALFAAGIAAVSIGMAVDTRAKLLAATWQPGQTVSLGGVQVSLSKPVLVARSHDYIWFPVMTRLANGNLFATLQTSPDTISWDVRNAVDIWSSDGGLTWSSPISVNPNGARGELYTDATLRLTNENEYLYPYTLYPDGSGGAIGSYQVVPGQQGAPQTVTMVKDGLTVTGWPKTMGLDPDNPGRAGFGFFGQGLSLPNGDYLAALYGHFDGDTGNDRSTVLAASRDGANWTVRSVITGGVPTDESTLVQLKDGRLMCVLRHDSKENYLQSFSSDNGYSWTAPAEMPNVFSVDPSLSALSNGSLALSGGRLGLDLWLNFDGGGTNWQQIDLLANHNAMVPGEQISTSSPPNYGQTTSYTNVQALDATHLIVMYDRVPYGWNAIPSGSTETNSIWAIQVTIVPEPSAIMLLTAAGLVGLLAYAWRKRT